MVLEIIRGASSSLGVVPGPYQEESLVCQYTTRTNSQGCIWLGIDPLSYSTPLLFAQFVIFFLVSRTVYLFLKPLSQSTMAAQIIAGIIMGPFLLAQDQKYKEIFLPPGGKLVIGVVADVGFMFYLFLLGVQTDTSMLKSVGRNSALIGTTGYALSVFLGGVAMYTLAQVLVPDMMKSSQSSLSFIVFLNSVSSFPVITSLLADLRILNSEIGRLAASSTLVTDLWSYAVTVTIAKIGIAVEKGQWSLLWSMLWISLYVLVIVYGLRPLLVRIANQIPEGHSVKEAHFIFILVLVLCCGFGAEVLGLHSGLGSFMLGMAIPEGPPLGETLVYKLEALTTGLLLPLKFVVTGLHTDLSSIRNASAMAVELVIIFGYSGKFLGTLLTALYCSVPVRDAISLALVVCCKGIVDVALFSIYKEEEILSNQEYTLLIITMLVVTGVARPLVGHLYDPSRRYKVHNRRSVLQSRRGDVELRILVCIHNEDNVPAIISLLEASNPTKQNPLSVFVLNLMELKGRAAAVLVPDYSKGKLSSALSHSRHIVNAFAYSAQHHQGRLLLHHFTAFAPYASMHDDVCTLALDERVTIVIVPFHKQWTIDGTVGEVFPSIRAVNLNVLNKAPCSVGVLVDRTPIRGSWSVLTGQTFFHVALLFLGGADDREALAYASRMTNHPHVILTVVWVRLWSHKTFKRKEMEDNLDIELMNEFRNSAMGKERIVFTEEIVEDAEGTTMVIHSMEEDFDLFIVGRHHEPGSLLTSGLTEWIECPELGALGDMLASWDFRFSVLVVQQQPIKAGSLDTPIGSRVHQEPPPGMGEHNTQSIIRSLNKV